MVNFDIEFCPHCGEQLNYVAYTCPECGDIVPEEAQFCPSCGSSIEEGMYTCFRCGKEITEEEIEALNAMPEDKRSQHLHNLNIAYEEKVRQYEEECEKNKRQKEIEHKEHDRKYAELKKREAELHDSVETWLAGKVDAVKDIQIHPSKIIIKMTKDNQVYRLTIPKENWNHALDRLLQSLDQFPSDIKFYTFERL